MGEHGEPGGSREHGEAAPLTNAEHALEIVERFNAKYTSNAEAVAALDLKGTYDDELDLMRDGTPLADGNLLRNELIGKYLPVLDTAGLGLSTLTDPGIDKATGKRASIDPSKPLALAVTIADAKKFSETLGAMPDNDSTRRFVHHILTQTAGVIRGSYDSGNEDEAASTERLLAAMSEAAPGLIKRYPDYQSPYFAFGGIEPLVTLTHYLQHHEAGTLEDYLGAEKRDIVTENAYASGPGEWGSDKMFKPLYSPEAFEEKWKTALDYMKELHDKQSPLFSQLFPKLRDQFNSSAAWLAEGAERTEETTQKLAVLQALEPLWSQYFAETDVMHQLGKEVEASQLAQYVIGFGLETNQVPELGADVDEISVEAARGLLRDQAQHAFEAGQHLPSHRGIDQYTVRQDPATGMEYTLKNLPERAQLLWRKQKTGSLPVPQIEVRLTHSSNNETVILEKDISHRADGANGLGMRLQAIIDNNGVRARVRNAHMAGQTHYNHWLSPAESIQAATAMMTHVETEAAPWASKLL